MQATLDCNSLVFTNKKILLCDRCTAKPPKQEFLPAASLRRRAHISVIHMSVQQYHLNQVCSTVLLSERSWNLFMRKTEASAFFAEMELHRINSYSSLILSASLKKPVPWTLQTFPGILEHDT